MNRKWEAKLKQIEERASHYERKPLSSLYRPRLSKPEEPPSIWKLFHRQTQAFNFVRSCKEHVCKALQELYSVNCSAEDVLNLDSSTDEKFSCHLIFQLHDVAFKDNIHVGNFVRKILQPALHLIASEDDNRLRETAGHGSPHFSEAPVEQGISFNKMSTDKDIGESWPLNSEKLERWGSAEQSSPELSFLVVKNNMGEKHLFVDLGVYTRNRNFRLYKSSKIGKRVALEVAEDNKFFPLQSKILVDLKNEVWYQKCHDPVCKAENFKSDCFPLPAEVCLLFLFKDEEEFPADEAGNNKTKNPHKQSPNKSSTGISSDVDWDNGIDDAYFLEATEDAELAEAAENSLLSYNSIIDEIPDELIIEV
ncbi:PREDICTED: DNA-directed primase/polymerase protein, partial [Propithecus coquereli]|uniref:DNA-directed primase/polymerase protein n=1 Tax=Propithecus coquereli TaxID=379532 RepID=UPI00063FBB7B